jgi:hypothetical protein
MRAGAPLGIDGAPQRESISSQRLSTSYRSDPTIPRRPETSYGGAMAHFWLTYREAGRLVGVVIIDAPSLIHARLEAAAYWCRGHHPVSRMATRYATGDCGDMSGRRNGARGVHRQGLDHLCWPAADRTSSIGRVDRSVR